MWRGVLPGSRNPFSMREEFGHQNDSTEQSLQKQSQSLFNEGGIRTIGFFCPLVACKSRNPFSMREEFGPRRAEENEALYLVAIPFQ